MPPEASKTAGWKIIAGYTAFSVFALVLSLYLTFPYDAVKQRVVAAASTAGLNLTLGSLGPGFFGVTARNLRLNKVLTPEQQRLNSETGTPEPTPLEIDSVAVRPALLPPGLAFRVNALDGVVSGSVGVLGSTRISASGDGLDFSKGNLKGFTGLDLAGKGELDLSLTVPTSAGTKTAPAEPDLGQANGGLELTLDSLTVNGGTLTVPMYGQPTPVPLPKVVLGNVEAKLKIEKGLGTVETFTAKGSDLEAGVTGTLKLAKRVEYSEPVMDIRLKLDPDFLKRLGMIGSAASMLPADPKDPTWRAFKVRGFLGRPDFPDLPRMR
jgi:type II secretion system protein N